MVRKIEACGVEKDTMINNLIIRQETEEDYKKTELMIMRSFWNKYWPGCTEHLLTRIIRDSQDYIPEISRIAEIDGQIVGAIYYTKAWIVDGNSRHEIATFGPLAVEPTWEGNDIGGALMGETIKLAQKQGIAGIVIIGEPYYYPHFGFERASKYKITDARGKSFDEIIHCVVKKGKQESILLALSPSLRTRKTEVTGKIGTLEDMSSHSVPFSLTLGSLLVTWNFPT